MKRSTKPYQPEGKRGIQLALACASGWMVFLAGRLAAERLFRLQPSAHAKHEPARKKDDKELARELYQNANGTCSIPRCQRSNQPVPGKQSRSTLSRHDPAARDKAALQELLRKQVPAIDVDKLDERTVYEKFLEVIVGLDKAEISEVESPSLTLLDAHYLEGCNLLREVERSLMLQDLTPLEQAQRCFDWVMRHVLLQEGRDRAAAAAIYPEARAGQRG